MLADFQRAGVPADLGDAAAAESAARVAADPGGRHRSDRPRLDRPDHQGRGDAAGFDPAALSGHSLKRGAMNTAKDRRVHPSQLKQLGRHANYATLGAYLDEGDLFQDNALNGVL
jgi:hypothetical protein